MRCHFCSRGLKGPLLKDVYDDKISSAHNVVKLIFTNEAFWRPITHKDMPTQIALLLATWKRASVSRSARLCLRHLVHWRMKDVRYCIVYCLLLRCIASLLCLGCVCLSRCSLAMRLVLYLD